MAPLGGIAGMLPLPKPAIDDGMQARSSSMVPSFVRSYENEDDQSPQVIKKSVLARVKEKARRWRNTLSKRKNEANSTPAWGVSLEEEDEEDATEYHGAPMYDSEIAPGDYKDATVHHTASPSPVINEKHVSMSKDAETEQSSITLTESVTNILAPAYAIVSEATQMIASKLAGLPVGPTAAPREESSTEKNGGKGVSVKELLMQKLEPGEEEKALSQVISDTMSPRKASDNGEMGMVERVKGAVSSLLWMEEQPSKATVTVNPLAEIMEEKEERRLQPTESFDNIFQGRKM